MHADHDHHNAHEGATGKRLEDAAEQIWIDTVGSVALISIAPFIVLMFVPDLNKHRNLLKILLGFAAGGLLGDAFLHLIPHALSPSHGHSHDSESRHAHSFNSPEMTVPCWVIGGIFCFLCIDKVLRFLKPGHGHSHDAPKQSNQANALDASKKNKKQNNNNSGGGEVKPSAQGDSNKPQQSSAQNKKKITSS